MLLSEIQHPEDQSSKGSYAGVKFDKQTTDKIAAFQKTHNINNPVPNDKLHTTLLYSRKFLPNYKANGPYAPPMAGTFKGFDIWESQADEDNHKNKCLVMEYSCPDLTARHNKLMGDHDASYDFDEYKPHITLSYDYDGDVDKLPSFTDTITVNEEYGEDINDTWAKDNT